MADGDLGLGLFVYCLMIIVYARKIVEIYKALNGFLIITIVLIVVSIVQRYNIMMIWALIIVAVFIAILIVKPDILTKPVDQVEPNTPEKERSNIFNNLIDFGYQRSKKEALVFYLVYQIFTPFLTILFAIPAITLYTFDPLQMLHVPQMNSDLADAMGYSIYATFNFCVPVGISFLIIKAKNQLKNPSCILLILLSGVLALFLSHVVTLIPVAYLTTKPTIKSEKISFETQISK
jgi:hypothetical protein